MDTRKAARTIQIIFRVTPAEKIELERAAKEDETARSLSDYIRARALESARQ